MLVCVRHYILGILVLNQIDMVVIFMNSVNIRIYFVIMLCAKITLFL